MLRCAHVLFIFLFACGQSSTVTKAPGSECAQTASDKDVCLVAPGEFPPPDCDPSAKQCAASSTCAIDQKKCGATSTCLPLGDNSKQTIKDFRIRRINVAAPDALAALPVQSGIITRGIDLAAKECGELGGGTFNWLLRVDLEKSQLTTGGAPPSPDPFAQGFCFFDKKVGTLAVKPASGVPLTIRGDVFNSGTIAKLVIPLFRASGDPILLPLTNVTFRGTTISSDGNCIGAFNANALAADCSDDPTKCQKWKTGGAIAGSITLEEADAVEVTDLQESLCALLVKQKGPDGKCVRQNGKIVAKGDYCSSTLKACDCQDSFWLAATFAASAVTINDGASVPECSGGGP